MAEPWVTVYSGAFPEVLATQAVLESNGIPTVMPGAMMKSVDPFMTGANPLDAFLQVPISALPLATEILGSRAEGNLSANSRATDDQSARSPELRKTAKLVGLARGLRWCFAIPVFGWLIGSFLGVQYFWQTRGNGARPAGHRVTLLLWLAQILGVLAVSIFGP